MPAPDLQKDRERFFRLVGAICLAEGGIINRPRDFSPSLFYRLSPNTRTEPDSPRILSMAAATEAPIQKVNRINSYSDSRGFFFLILRVYKRQVRQHVNFSSLIEFRTNSRIIGSKYVNPRASSEPERPPC